MADTIWRGRTSNVRWVLLAIFLFSLITWAMGCAYTVRLANADLGSAQYYKRVSTATLYFYAAGLPMATMLAAAIDYLLFMRGWLSPVASIIWSIIAFGLWIFVLLMWGVTEGSPDFGGFLPLYVYEYWTEVYASSLLYARLATGSISATLALVQMSFAARSVQHERKGRGKSKQFGR